MRLFSVALALGTGTAALAAPTADPIRAPAAVTFGGHFVLAGRFAGAAAGEPVDVRFREHGESSFATLALISTDAAGRWRLTVRPTIGTRYEAASLGRVAGPVGVGVRPLLTLKRRSRGFVVTVRSSASYERRYALLQRHVANGWRKLAKVVLRRSPRRFEVPLPSGVSHVRAFLPRSQAGAGYLSSTSNVVLVRR